ncbi:hypothetical protein [Pseudonocardia sp. NPDC049635]|uniref:hypothetical protein n=1 Tax=Pseudonocardia sp. NPDC049635 TaxID=3155506 RepID=UPI0033F63F89
MSALVPGEGAGSPKARVRELEETMQLLRAGTLAGVLAALVLPLAVAVAPEALATDGRDRTPTGELAAVYQHAFTRAPSGAERERDLQLAGMDCHWGVLDFSFRAMTSPEARGRWDNDPQDLAGMLYAGLLDRAPDAEGLQTSTRSIQQRGLEWATTEMLASPEYHRRIDRICQGLPSTGAAMMTWSDAVETAQSVVESRRQVAGVTCWLDSTVWAGLDAFDALLRTDTGKEKDPRTLKAKKDLRVETLKLFDDLVKGVDRVMGGSGGEDECAAEANFMRAGERIVEIAVPERVGTDGGHNAVFVQEEQVKIDNLAPGHRTKATWRVGANPTSWEPFEGTVREYPKVILR